MPDASDQKPPYNMLSGNSSDGTYTSSPRTLYGSENGHDFPGIEVFVADQTPELVPVERSPSLSQPQRFPIHEPKPWLKFMKPKQEQNEKTPPPKDNDTNSSRRRRRWRLWLLLTILAVGIIIALAIALPLSLRPRARESSSKAGSTVSTSEAINGTGLALLQLGTSNQDYMWHLYYQHQSGEIRDLQLQNYEWVPASLNNVGLTANARNGTPLAVATFTENAENYPTYHIYYVDSSGILQETVNSQGKSQWQRGQIGNSMVTPSKSSSVGLTACSNERWDGGNVTDPAFELYYGGSDGLIHELMYHFNNQSWNSRDTFADTNGNGGIACSFSNTSFSYMFSSSKDNKLQLWWKDYNDTAANRAANTDTHPLGVWTQVPNPAPIALYPNSSIARIRTSDTEDLIFYLTPSLTISALQPTLAAENSTWGSPLQVGPGAFPGVGSQLATTTMFEGNYLLRPNMTEREDRSNRAFQVFFQEGDGGVKQFMRRWDGGQWTSTDVLGQ